MATPELMRRFTEAARSPDPDLATAALLIARVEYPALDAARYLARLDALGAEACRRLADADRDRRAQVVALSAFLFDEQRFTGNEADYEDPRNSFLNEVIDRRTGIPITLSVLYMEVARRAGLPVDGINYPGHFLLHTADLIIDPFHRGALISRERLTLPPGDDELPRASKPQILTRMLTNLKRIYMRMHSFPQARDVIDLLIAVDPSASAELRDRGLLAYQLRDFPAALRDLQGYLAAVPPGPRRDDEREDRERIWEHVKTLRKRVASLN